MKVLVCSDNALGNTVSDLLPLLPTLKSHGARIHGWMRNKHAYRLMRETPYFDKILMIYDGDDLNEELIVDAPQYFEGYDKVYVVNNRLLPGVVKRQNSPLAYRPAMRMAEYGEPFSPGDILLDINWYDDFYEDFRCEDNTVLLNTKATSRHRNYKQALRPELVKLGFDVIEFDYDKDIRTNLHLVHQAKHILTVDTSTMWLARSLGKVPHVFMARESGTIPSFGKNTEIFYDLKNLIPWKKHLEETEPQLIAQRFADAVQGVPMF